MKKAPPEAGPKASKQNSQDQYNTPSHSRLITRADYARSAVFEKFRPRDARAIDHRDFRDRAPADEPCRWRPPHQWSTGLSVSMFVVSS